MSINECLSEPPAVLTNIGRFPLDSAHVIFSADSSDFTNI